MSFRYIKNVFEKIKKFDKDVKDYQKIVQNPSLPSIAYVSWAIHLAESGDIDKAEEKLVSSTLMAHQTPEAYINLGVIKAKNKKFQEAKELYNKALSLDCENAKAYCFLGNVLTEMREYEKAEENYGYALKIEPINPDILLNLGICLVRQQKFLQAKEKFIQANKMNSSNLLPIHFLGLVELELGEIEAAKEKFKFIIGTSPENYEATYYLAYIYYKEKNYEKSLSLALKSHELYKKKIETYMLIAENHMHLENKEECLKYYELGEKECNPSYYFLISWGVSLQSFKNYEVSKEKFQKAIDINDKFDMGFGYLGISCYKENDIDNALIYLNKALELNDKSTIALDCLGRIEFDKRNYKEAIKYFELVLKISAKAVENYLKIANAYFFDENPQKASEYYNKALEYQPEEIQVYLDFANFLIEQKDYELATKKLQTAYKLNPENVDCLNQLFYSNYLLANENLCDYNVERAIEIAQYLEENYPDSFQYKAEKQVLHEKLKGKGSKAKRRLARTMKEIVVQKFGGTSVADTDKMRVATEAIIREKELGNDVVVVVSAMGHTTDYLIKMAKDLSQDKAPSAREMDMLLSTGEGVSIALLAMAIQARGYEAVSLNAMQIGIITENVHLKARIIDINTEKLRENLNKGKIIVVAGFQGITEDGEITTLGRGGSDTSAVALAAALKAKRCDIYTDVEGVYSTDPRVVPTASKIEKISYDEMLELARVGANVLHPRSVETAKQFNVPLRVRSTFKLDNLGTLIVGVNDMEIYKPVTGLAADLTQVRVVICDVPDIPGHAAKLFGELAKENISVDMIIQSYARERNNTNDIAFTIDKADLDRAGGVLEKIKTELKAQNIHIDNDIAKVTIVGAGMVDKPGIAATMFDTIAGLGINIKMISTSEIKISCLVKKSEAEISLKALHKVFDLESDIVAEVKGDLPTV